jgi:hypothetical protein
MQVGLFFRVPAALDGVWQIFLKLTAIHVFLLPQVATRLRNALLALRFCACHFFPSSRFP